MRRFSAIFFLMCLATFVLTGCGGDDSSGAFGAPAKITLSSVPTNMNPGQVSPILATVYDSKDLALAGAPLKYASSNTNALQVATNGQICAGKWDALDKPVTCTPGESGTVEVTVSTENNVSNKFTVYVHKKVTRIDVTSADAAGCRSQNETRQYSAKVFAGTEDITSQVGSVSFRTTEGAVVSIDSAGKATAKNPGRTDVFASVAGVVSTPVAANVFETCRVVKINLKIKDSADTTISQAAGATKTVVAEMIDSAGKAVLLNNASELRWTTLNSTVATIANVAAPTDGSFATANQATVAGSRPGYTAVSAICGPRVQDTSAECNIGLEPVFSNVIPVQTTGTPSANVYVADPESDTIIPITNNAAGTAIPLKNASDAAVKPNSMLIAPNGGRLFIGTAEGLITVDTATNGANKAIASMPGKVLAVSPDSTRAIVANDATDEVFIVGASTTAVSQLRKLTIADAQAAAFSTDPERVYVVTPSNVYYIEANDLPVTVAGGATDATLLANGALAYFAASGSIPVRAFCNNAFITGLASSGARVVRYTNDGKRVIAATPTGLDVVNVSGTFETPPDSCQPGVAHERTAVTLGSGIDVRDLVVTPDSTRAFIVAPSTTLLGYNLTTSAAANITLAGSAPATAAGVTTDAALMYVGTNDKKIHRIELATGNDAQQITVTINPVFVAVRSF